MFLRRRISLILLVSAACGFASGIRAQQAPVVVNTNVTIRVMAANISSGNFQRYETPGLNILKGLKPDVVAIQEFSYLSSSNGLNTAAAIREMIDKTFGTNFVYFRESGKNIPNGVISRFPILTSGVWDDTQISDREFVWAKLDLPGTNDLYVVSVHLKASSSDASVRAVQGSNLKNLIQANFPANAFVVVGGDLNIHSTNETALATFKTYLSDNPVPTDATSGGDPDTNAGRSERYDYVLPSPTLANHRVATVIGSQTFGNGLVFDSRIYTPLSDVSPVAFGNSGVSGMQHMAVVKDFKINYTITNFVTVPSPTLVLNSTNVIRWNGLSNVTYSVQASTNLPTFSTVGAAISTTTNVVFTNQNSSETQRFYRVVYP